MVKSDQWVVIVSAQVIKIDHRLSKHLPDNVTFL